MQIATETTFPGPCINVVLLPDRGFREKEENKYFKSQAVVGRCKITFKKFLISVESGLKTNDRQEYSEKCPAVLNMPWCTRKVEQQKGYLTPPAWGGKVNDNTYWHTSIEAMSSVTATNTCMSQTSWRQQEKLFSGSELQLKLNKERMKKNPDRHELKLKTRHHKSAGWLLLLLLAVYSYGNNKSAT